MRTAASGIAGGRWRRQHETELDGDKWSVVYGSDKIQVIWHETYEAVDTFLSVKNTD